MIAIARGSITEPQQVGPFFADAKRGSGRSSHAQGGGRHRATLPRRAAFWSLAAVLCLLFVATAAPAPLYGVYQDEWHFSVTTLTAVFAVYALVLLVTLLMLGSASDYFGRRRTIVAGLAVYGMACGVFLAAEDVATLFVGRALQGVAVGLATGALGAAMLELQPEGTGLAAPVTSAAGPLGLAIGGLGASALVQYGPAPTHLVWWLLLGAGLALVVAVLAVPESRATRSRTRPSFRPRLRVPREARGVFAVALPCLIGAWALSGFYLSLGPSLVAQLLRSQNLLWGGVVIALLFGVGVPVTLTARNSSPSKVMLGGCGALFAGAVITFVAIATRTPAVLLAGTAVAGLGWGPAFLGAYGTIVALARPEDRAGLIAAIFTVGYLAFSIPAVIAGVATSEYGLHKTALVYSSIVAVLAATAAASLAVRRARAGRVAIRAAAYPESPTGSPTIRLRPAEPCQQRKANATTCRGGC
jgi:predicted MFS family arabinose efflux permease